MKKLLIALMLFPAMVHAQKLNETNYRIYSSKTGKKVTLKDVVSDMENYDVVIFGEEHNDSVGHYLEASLLELMHLKFGKDLALSLEMFDRDVQPVMNEYLQGYIREKHFKKDARAWSNYRDYKPMVDFARKKELDVICANAPARYANLAGRMGFRALNILPDESRPYLAPIPFDTAKGEYRDKLLGVTHDDGDDTAKHAPPPMMGSSFNLVLAQSTWDATMAYSITEYLKKKANRDKKIVHVNGRFHSDGRFAVVEQLANYNDKLKVLVISSGAEASFPDVDMDTHERNGDYIIITDPKVPKTYAEN